MKKQLIKTITIILVLYSIDMNAQWSLTGPTSTNSNINIGGLQFGKFHVTDGTASFVAELNSNPYFKLFYLTRNRYAFSGFPNPKPTLTGKPSWGMEIEANNRLSISYVELLNQPTAHPLIPGQLVYPTPTEVFSINTTDIVSKVNMNLWGNLSFIGLGVARINAQNGLYLNSNVTVNGSFKVQNAAGENQFAIDNNGYVRARELKVDFQIIPDYVFKKGYKLMPLNELAIYIEQNKHLPNIKSENEFNHEEGIGIGEMNLKLLEKVEEQTLYIIQLHKKLEELQIQINNLK